MKNPTWVYHRIFEAKIVDSIESEKLYNEGWKDSPAHFKPQKVQEDNGKTTNEAADEATNEANEKPIKRRKKGLLNVDSN